MSRLDRKIARKANDKTKIPRCKRTRQVRGPDGSVYVARDPGDGFSSVGWVGLDAITQAGCK